MYGKDWRREDIFDGVKVTSAAFDGNFVKVNSKYVGMVYPATGGGSFIILRHDQAGKVKPDAPLFSGHSNPVQDIDFSPFNDNIIASSSEDCTVKVWSIPEGGPSQTVTQPLMTLSGHQKRVGILMFNPVASNVLASCGSDGTVITWDAERGQARSSLADHGGAVQSLSWNYDGSFFATTCQDKLLRIVDPRAGRTSASAPCHQGNKGSRVIFLGRKDRIATTGFAKGSDREMMVFDARNISTPLSTNNIDQQAGMLMPFYDSDLDILYVGGKGDGNIRYFESTDSDKYLYDLSVYKHPDPQRGLGYLPKSACNVQECEIARFYRATPKNQILVVSMIVPRKGDINNDIYPDTPSTEAALSASEYFAGRTSGPRMMNMSSRKTTTASNYSAAPVTSVNVTKPTPAPVAASPATAPASVAAAPVSRPVSAPVAATPVAAAAPATRAVSAAPVATAAPAASASEIQQLKNRIAELELENARLRSAQQQSVTTSSSSSSGGGCFGGGKKKVAPGTAAAAGGAAH